MLSALTVNIIYFSINLLFVLLVFRNFLLQRFFGSGFWNFVQTLILGFALRLKKGPEGLRLLVQSDYIAANRPKLERLSKLLQPEIRDPALAETFWELAGADLAPDTSELALVGQILDSAHVTLQDSRIELDLFVAC